MVGLGVRGGVRGVLWHETFRPLLCRAEEESPFAF